MMLVPCHFDIIENSWVLDNTCIVKAIVFIGYFHEIKTSEKFGTYILIRYGEELLVHWTVVWRCFVIWKWEETTVHNWSLFGSYNMVIYRKSFRFYNQESIMASWWFMVNLLHLHTVREFGNRWLSNSELHSHLAFECYLINKLSLNVKRYVYLFDSYVFLQLLLWFRKSILEYR